MLVKLLRKVVGSTRFFMAFISVLMAWVLRENPAVYATLAANLIAWIYSEHYRKT